MRQMTVFSLPNTTYKSVNHFFFKWAQYSLYETEDTKCYILADLPGGCVCVANNNVLSLNTVLVVKRFVTKKATILVCVCTIKSNWQRQNKWKVFKCADLLVDLLEEGDLFLESLYASFQIQAGQSGGIHVLRVDVIPK